MGYSRWGVQWAYEKISAQKNVEGLMGVKGVTNNIQIKATTTEKETAEQIAWSSPGVLVVDNKIDIDSEVYA